MSEMNHHDIGRRAEAYPSRITRRLARRAGVHFDDPHHPQFELTKEFQMSQPAIKLQSGPFGVDYAQNYYRKDGDSWIYLSPVTDAVEHARAMHCLSPDALERKIEDRILADGARATVPNEFAVSSNGAFVRAVVPRDRNLSRAEALNLATWLVVNAGCCGDGNALADFEALYKEASK